MKLVTVWIDISGFPAPQRTHVWEADKEVAVEVPGELFEMIRDFQSTGSNEDGDMMAVAADWMQEHPWVFALPRLWHHRDRLMRLFVYAREVGRMGSTMAMVRSGADVRGRIRIMRFKDLKESLADIIPRSVATVRPSKTGVHR